MVASCRSYSAVALLSLDACRRFWGSRPLSLKPALLRSVIDFGPWQVVHLPTLLGNLGPIG